MSVEKNDSAAALSNAQPTRLVERVAAKRSRSPDGQREWDVRGPAAVGRVGGVRAHGSSRISLADQLAFARPARLVWRKRRWRCPERSCSVATFTDRHHSIVLPRRRMTRRQRSMKATVWAAPAGPSMIWATA